MPKENQNTVKFILEQFPMLRWEAYLGWHMVMRDAFVTLQMTLFGQAKKHPVLYFNFHLWN